MKNACDHLNNFCVSTCEECGEDLCKGCKGDFKDGDVMKEWIPGSHKCPEVVKVCGDCHPEREIPLIWTFAFNGCEYWCPFCGWAGGMLGAGVNVPFSKKLRIRRESYKRLAQPYLDANSALCCAQLIWDGEWISPRDLPDFEKKRLLEASKTWKNGVVLL
jgi:hypothetical protein